MKSSFDISTIYGCNIKLLPPLYANFSIIFLKTTEIFSLIKKKYRVTIKFFYEKINFTIYYYGLNDTIKYLKLLNYKVFHRKSYYNLPTFAVDFGDD